MNPGIFENIWTSVVVRIQDSTAQLIIAMQGWVGPRFQLCVGAYLVVMLMIAFWSNDENAFQRFFRDIFLAAILYSVVATLATYQTYVQGLANGLSSGISLAIAGVFGNAHALSANSFDVIAIKIFDKGLSLLDGLSWYSPKLYFLGMGVIAYWFVSFAALLVIFVIYMLSTVETNFVLSFGSLFIALYFFPITRKFFDGWVSCVFAGVLTQVFAIGWLTLFVVSIQGLMTSIANTPSNGGVNDIATMIMNICMIAGLLWIFAGMTAVSAFVAVRIAGGIYSGLTDFQSRGSAANAPAGGGSVYGHPPANDPYGSAPPSVGPLPNNPPPQYAFNRTIGAAP